MRFVTILVVALLATIVSSVRVVHKKFAETKAKSQAEAMAEFGFAIPTAITCPICQKGIVVVEAVMKTEGCDAAAAAILPECPPCAEPFAAVCPILLTMLDKTFTPAQACGLMKLC